MNEPFEFFGPKTLNDLIFEKAVAAFRKLFELAKESNELDFAFALTPEFRGTQDPGWNTANEAKRAMSDYTNFLQKREEPGIRARVALGFYCHISEAAGFYETPKNLLRIASGQAYGLWPFNHLVKKHSETGSKIAPNSNKIISDLVGHAEDLGLHDLSEVFRDAFDPDLRNGYAHADYVIWTDGIRLPKRNGGIPKLVTWDEFNRLLERGVEFFTLIDEIVEEYLMSYHPAKIIKGNRNDQPEEAWKIEFNPTESTFTICNVAQYDG